MYCWNCGHKNPEANKFCGDCGKIQVRPPVFVEEDTITDNVRTMNRPAEPVKPAPPAAPVAPPPGTGIMPTRLVGTNPLVEESRAVKDEPLPAAVDSIRPPAPQDRPSADLPPARISGPSFLGLSDAPPSSEYLLDEEETDGPSNARSFLALALLVLFAFLVYKQWDSVSAAGRAVMQRAGSAIPETTQTAQNTTPQEPVASDSSASSETAGNDSAKADDMPQGDKVKAEPAEKATEPDVTQEAQTTPAREEKDSATSEPPPAPAKADRELREAEPRAPVYDQSQIDLAEKYLQGRGVAQDCHRGITLLRQAASQPNPRAQIKLGALYATGHCVGQDRAEAYRWFAEAHQLQPNNQWIDRNLSSLWAQMSSAERARVQR